MKINPIMPTVLPSMDRLSSGNSLRPASNGPNAWMVPAPLPKREDGLREVDHQPFHASDLPLSAGMTGLSGPVADFHQTTDATT